LDKLGFNNIKKIHLNEGHGAFAAIELFKKSSGNNDKEKIKKVRKKIVFTTHTPLLSAQDFFSLETVLKYQEDFPKQIKEIISDSEINTTKLSFFFSGCNNAVSKIHQKISSKDWSKFKIDYITNGVYAPDWIFLENKKLYNQYCGFWKENNNLLKKAKKIPLKELKNAHLKAKKSLFDFVYKKTKKVLDKNIFTIGFARRFTAYKRPDLLLLNPERLIDIHKKYGKLQVIYAGKAHPDDRIGQEMINKILNYQEKHQEDLKIIFLENYDIEMAKLLVAGVDLWLNTPLKLNEASGTSGMKAALNGVPQLSVLDGWWVEGFLKNKTGWSIKSSNNDFIEANFLYDELEKNIFPIFYKHPKKWLKIIRNVIAINGPKFNSQRMLKEYIKKIYKI
jgi:starch phosphorylase